MRRHPTSRATSHAIRRGIRHAIKRGIKHGTSRAISRATSRGIRRVAKVGIAYTRRRRPLQRLRRPRRFAPGNKRARRSRHGRRPRPSSRHRAALRSRRKAGNRAQSVLGLGPDLAQVAEPVAVAPVVAERVAVEPVAVEPVAVEPVAVVPAAAASRASDDGECGEIARAYARSCRVYVCLVDSLQGVGQAASGRRRVQAPLAASLGGLPATTVPRRVFRSSDRRPSRRSARCVHCRGRHCSRPTVSELVAAGCARSYRHRTDAMPPCRENSLR